jgi:hypothetical protein
MIGVRLARRTGTLRHRLSLEAGRSTRGTVMPLYRAYLIENGHVWTAIDLTCVNDDDAKRQAANLSSGHDVELWQGDRAG